jgi:hypothetical protein
MKIIKGTSKLEDYIKKDIGMDIFLDMDINGHLEDFEVIGLYLSYKKRFSS